VSINWSAFGTVIASLLSAYVLFRSRTPAILKDELVITRERCQRLEKETAKLADENHIKDLVIADLKAKTDLTDIRQTLKEVMNISAVTAQTLSSVADTLKSISHRLPPVTTA
jgi:septation ring formation regulator EzrA